MFPDSMPEILTHINPFITVLAGLLGGAGGTATIMLMGKRFLLRFLMENTKEAGEKSQITVISMLTEQYSHQVKVNTELTNSVHDLLKELVRATNETIAVKNSMVELQGELNIVLNRLNVYERRASELYPDLELPPYDGEERRQLESE